MVKCGCADDLEQRLLEKGTHDESLPLPGQLVNADFRDVKASANTWADIAAGRPVRVVQWNIERGIEFDAILETLKQLQADVLLIQEVDNGCDRTDGRDVGALSSPKCLSVMCLLCLLCLLLTGCMRGSPSGPVASRALSCYVLLKHISSVCNALVPRLSLIHISEPTRPY